MSQRRRGTVGVVEKASGALLEEAKAILKAKEQAATVRRAERANTPVPNHIAYRNIVFFVGKNIDHNGNWLGGLLPKCRKCEERLDPKDHHVCSGFTAKYVQHDQDWHDRQDQRREDIEESRPWTYDYDGEPIVICDVCGERMYDPEDAYRHEEDHGGKPEDNRHTRDGEPDGDLDGYDDEAEDDYCEGADDGYDCD